MEMAHGEAARVVDDGVGVDEGVKVDLQAGPLDPRDSLDASVAGICNGA